MARIGRPALTLEEHRSLFARKGEWESGDVSSAELQVEFGISPPTLYKYMRGEPGTVPVREDPAKAG